MPTAKMTSCPKCGGNNFATVKDGKGNDFQRCRDCANEYHRGLRDHAIIDALKEGGDALTAFGTPMQRASAEALLRCGTVRDAAQALQLEPNELRAHLNELRRQAAKRGWAPSSDMTKATPDGYHVKGVSTYYKVQPDGSKVPSGQWVKTNKDEEHKVEALLEAMEHVADAWRGLADPAAAPGAAEADLLAVYTMGDPHLGMYAWAAETGQSFDLQIAERELVGAVDHLVDLAPAAEEALIINLGDFFHADNQSNQTSRAHHALDVDTRWGKVLSVGIRAMRRCIDCALVKHKRVRVVCEIGNHDDHSAIMLAICLQQYYEREPRVAIDTSPAKFHWLRFGDCLIGITHGDTVKMDQLPGIMACDRPEDWGATKYRYWYTGHVHHDAVREYPGCLVESFRTLAPADAWSRSMGYRSGQDMKADVLHRKWGRINRHIVGIKQLRAEMNSGRITREG